MSFFFHLDYGNDYQTENIIIKKNFFVFFFLLCINITNGIVRNIDAFVIYYKVSNQFFIYVHCANTALILVCFI